MAGGIGHKLRYYSYLSIINVTIGTMLFMVTIAPPPVKAFSPDTHRLPIKIHSIPATQGTPVRVVLDSLGIDLPIRVGSYNPTDSTWTISTTEAFYADISVPVNNGNGTTLIYAHARPGLFGDLPDIQPDAEALIYTDSGYVFHYHYLSMQSVDPSDVSSITSSGPPTLILQTCTGDWSEYRALFNFKLTAITKA